MDGRFGRAMGILGGRRAFKRTGARMRAHWIEFATTGGVSGWPLYDEATRETLIFDEADRVEADPRSSRREAWQAFVPHV
jgi:para-nitrobenzyl esterase